MVYADQMQAAFHMHNSSGGVHQGCMETMDKAESWRCNTAEAVYPVVKSQIYAVNSVYDSWQLACIYTATPVQPGKVVHTKGMYRNVINGNCTQALGWEKCTPFNALISPSKCTVDQVTMLNHWRGEILSRITKTKTYETKGNGVFLHSCHGHCLGAATLTWNMIKHAGFVGTSIRSAVEKWWLDDSDGDHNYLPCEWPTANRGAFGNCNPSCDVPI